MSEAIITQDRGPVERRASPPAPPPAGAFLGGLRLMAVDGTNLDVADTPANAREFGRPTTRRGAGAFPQLRAVARDPPARLVRRTSLAAETGVAEPRCVVNGDEAPAAA